MSIKKEINEQLKQALKEKESEKAQTLRSLLSAIKNSEIQEKGELKKEDEIAILKKESKQRKEAIKQYQDGDRDDLAEKEEKELKIIKDLMPKMMSEEEIKKVVDKVIEQTGAQDKSDLGKVMGQVMSQLKSKADGEKVREVVEKALS